MSEDILADIDDTLTDWNGSADSARWRGEPDEGEWPRRTPGPHLHIEPRPYRPHLIIASVADPERPTCAELDAGMDLTGSLELREWT